MERKSLLDGKKVLIVDDEPDILDTLEDLLPMCRVVKASRFEDAKTLLDEQRFDLAILDIMGVSGYQLLETTTQKKITSVMLTAYALTPEDVVTSYRKGAAFYIPKEEMVNIVTFLEDILAAIAEGKNPWSRWYEQLSAFCERKFGPDWRASDKEFWERFPFY